MLKLFNIRKKTLGIDFDGTLCNKQPYGDGTIYETPTPHAREVMDKLYKEYKIVIFTTRLSPKFGGDISKKYQEIADWLKLHQIPYDELTNNKPEAMAYIDDRAIRFTNWLDIKNYFLQ